jgi:hypothetical protein
MNVQSLTIACLALVAGGCAAQGSLNNPNLQALSVCSAGHRQTLSADVDAKVAQDLRDGQLSATLASEIKGLFLSDPNLPAEDRLPAYERYLECIKQRT